VNYPGSTSTPELSQLNQDFHPSEYQETVGTGFVKRRIGEFEVLFMQLCATPERIIATIKEALKNKQAVAGSYGSGLVEVFMMGSTRLYDSRSLSHEGLQAVLGILAQSDGKPTPVPCGNPNLNPNLG
jgi:hypothetical protein